MQKIAVLMSCLFVSMGSFLQAEELTQHPMIKAMHDKSNALRAARGLPPHELSVELTNAAQDHAVFMCKTGQMSHYTNGSYQGRATRWGFKGSVRENIAMGYPNVESCFRAWQNSSGHAASLFSGTRFSGFGCYRQANGSFWWCAVYGNK